MCCLLSDVCVLVSCVCCLLSVVCVLFVARRVFAGSFSELESNKIKFPEISTPVLEKVGGLLDYADYADYVLC